MYPFSNEYAIGQTLLNDTKLFDALSSNSLLLSGCSIDCNPGQRETNHSSSPGFFQSLGTFI